MFLSPPPTSSLAKKIYKINKNTYPGMRIKKTVVNKIPIASGKWMVLAALKQHPSKLLRFSLWYFGMGYRWKVDHWIMKKPGVLERFETMVFKIL